MANKTLATRQKMHFRVEAAQKPRKPGAVAARQRIAARQTVAGAKAAYIAARRELKKPGPK